MSKNISIPLWPKIRKFFNDVHLWFGLISGIIILVVCLSGTIYVYNTEIRQAASPHLYLVENPGSKQAIAPDLLLKNLKDSINGKIVGIKIPYDKSSTYAILFKKKEEKSGKEDHGHGKEAKAETQASAEKGHGEKSGNRINSEKSAKKESAAQPGGRRPRASEFMIDPYTGRPLGIVGESKTRTDEFMQKMFGLHRWLLLNEVEEPIIEGLENRKLGSYITGTATILFTLGVLSGLIIWFPNKIRSWRNGLTIKRTKNWKRLNHDLHNTLGLYSFIILFLMGITGPQWSFEWYRTSLRKALGTHEAQASEKPKGPQSELPTGNQKLSVQEIISIGNTALPYEGDYTINFATDSVAPIMISKNKTGFFAPAASDKIMIDQYSGQILEKDIFSEKPLNERIAMSIKSLHIGDVYGQFSKLLYFIACLIATSLPVTGVFIWINKMKKPGLSSGNKRRFRKRHEQVLKKSI